MDAQGVQSEVYRMSSELIGSASLEHCMPRNSLIGR